MPRPTRRVHAAHHRLITAELRVAAQHTTAAIIDEGPDIVSVSNNEQERGRSGFILDSLYMTEPYGSIRIRTAHYGTVL